MFKPLMPFLLLFLVTFSFAQDIDSVAVEKPKQKIGMYIPYGNGREMKLTFLLQTWLRYTETNPGTTVYGDPQSEIVDIGIRRARITLSGSPVDRVFVYTQFGMNNFNYISEREAGFFFHDAITEYEVAEEKLFIGGGLTAWAGFSRFSTPSIGSLLALDAPLYAQATNGGTDQFLRKLAVYGKGNLGNVNYRVAIAKPMAIQRSSQFTAINTNSTYSEKASKMQYQGYVVYNIFDQEKLKTPYFKGTYLGSKKVFNVGAGFLYQQDAMNHLTAGGDTSYTDLAIFSADVFYDVPLKNGAALSVYAAYHNYNFGPGYLRNVGAMNPANGVNSMGTINGAGSGAPVIGTGNNYYIQAGYLFGSENKTKFMPYASALLANYDRLDENMLMYDLGINMLLNGHGAKLTAGYQNRPVFETQADGQVTSDERKSLFVLQYQISI